MTREELAGLVVEHAVALYRVEKYEAKLIEAVQGIEAPEETKARFLAAAGVGDMDGYCMGEAMRYLYEMFGGQR